MRQKRRLVGRVLLGLLVIGMMAGSTIVVLEWQASQQERLDADLITTIQIHPVSEAQSLIDQGADPNARDSSARSNGFQAWLDRLARRGRASRKGGGTTALGRAVRSRYAFEMTSLLLERGADPHAPSNDDPLFWAAREGNARVVRLLLERGLDPNRVDRLGFTPLIAAVLSRDKETVRVLVDRGAKLHGIKRLGSGAWEFEGIRAPAEIGKVLERALKN
jgi:hypothetical protein